MPVTAQKSKMSTKIVNQNNINKLIACLSNNNFIDLYSESDAYVSFELFSNEMMYY